MADPFKLDGPACVSMSGGRTSAYMLWRILDANGGLPDDARVVFANTGKEAPATLRFVRQCAERWGVRIHWIERAENERGWVEVDFITAHRHGEPFAELIDRRGYLPNPVTRFCTSELKVWPMHRFLRSFGWPEWETCIGLRADEPLRVGRVRARGRSTESADETMRMPLADAGVGLREVAAFWERQSFGLDLLTVGGRTLEGNCDLCFCKPAAQRLSIIAHRPGVADWWVRMESLGRASRPLGARFTKDGPSYAQLVQFAADQRDLFDTGEASLPCMCGD